MGLFNWFINLHKKEIKKPDGEVLKDYEDGKILQIDKDIDNKNYFKKLEA